jgi:cold shock protein
MVGKIAHLSDKGFGFIQSEGFEKNLFFHAKDLQNISFEDLKKGDEVEFEETETTEKGTSAKGITIV